MRLLAICRCHCVESWRRSECRATLASAQQVSIAMAADGVAEGEPSSSQRSHLRIGPYTAADARPAAAEVSPPGLTKRKSKNSNAVFEILVCSTWCG